MKVIIFYTNPAGDRNHWIVDQDRFDHCLKVMEAKNLIVTGYEKIV